jgi:O-acetyl-ADP-ribose deacetylase (regulator of RNase III)
MKEITGDLIKQAEQFDVIVHGCNCFCTMKSGIAPQIKLKWPEAYEADLQTVKGDKQKLGTLSHTTTTSPIVVNAYTQFQYGRTRRHCDYDALASCMKAIKSKFTGKKIGMPKIGAGLAGGDWEVIKTIIATELKGEDITIVKWEKE